MIDLSQVTEFIPTDEPPEQRDEEKFDFSSPEDVLIEVVGPHDVNGPKDWKNYSIESCTVINQANPVATGAASYDAAYGGFLDYTLQSMIDPPGEGWFVVVGVTGQYYKGDGWHSDDDITFEFKEVRPATDDEIKMA